MELLTLLNTLDTNLTRKTISLKKSTDACSWTNDDLFTASYTIDEETTELEDVIQICLANKNNAVYFYINYNNRKKYIKIALEDITDFEIEEE